MTRRFKRLRDFEINLLIKNDNFIRPPREAQRNWLLNKALAEFSENLAVLHRLSANFVRGSDSLPRADRTQACLDDEEIMENWQIPLMRALAAAVTDSHGDVLEIGFGRGISSGFIQECGVTSHTIIECNDSVIERFDAWQQRYANKNIHMVRGKWQDVLDDLGTFDGVFFHTYPLNEAEIVEQIGDSTTFAEHFFAPAAAHLNEGGVFTYLSNEIDSLSRSHQRALFEHFSAVEMRILSDLKLPADVQDAWWADSMVVVKVTR